MQLYWSGLASPHPSSTTTATGFPLGSFGWSGSVHETPELAIANETYQITHSSQQHVRRAANPQHNQTDLHLASQSATRRRYNQLDLIT
jgi:hypothetical protein